jgi:urease accessory protein
VLLVQAILGSANEARFAARRVERLAVTYVDASKRRLRGRTDAGSDVAVDLPRGTYLEDASVLFDDGERIVVAERVHEDALVIRFSPSLDQAELVRQAALAGHAFGNQHVPVEVVDGEICVPITTSREIARATAERLELDGAELRFARVPFGRRRPVGVAHSHPAPSHDHGHGGGAHRHE